MEFDRPEAAALRPATLAKALGELKRSENAAPFLAPVEWEELGLVDYPKVIRNPMDLKTVTMKLRRKEYASDDDFWSDVNLIWRNCQAYNEEDSSVYNMSIQMQQLTADIKQRYSETQPNFGPPGKAQQQQQQPTKQEPPASCDDAVDQATENASSRNQSGLRLRRQQATLCAKMSALSSSQLQCTFQFIAQEFPEALECNESQLMGRGSVTRHRSSHPEKVLSANRITFVIDRLDTDAVQLLRSFVGAVKKV